MPKRAATDLIDEYKESQTLTIDSKLEENVSGPTAPPLKISTAAAMTRKALKAQLDANFIKYNDIISKSFLIALLVETLEARSKIPHLNEDVQGHIVSFLSGFDSLRIASQLARGFRLKAKPRLDSMLERSDDDIHIAVRAWCEDAEAAREIYGPISIWNTSEVTSMSGLFSSGDGYAGEAAKQFNEDISKWDVSNVTTMFGMFEQASAFSGDLSSWNVSNVTNIEGMFQRAEAFNGDLSSWNVSNVTTMQAMFCQASLFNGNLSSWDVSNVTTMQAIFAHASACNGTTIANWDLGGKNTFDMLK
ncbi:hypothetical protein TrST_g6333 [Triparma strigata]|uniref:BspA family leucine-rich repeat surface protein n=1 Tax=Triparma strigata TaxID=1606541 RepID=A0A9W7F144_9STRA|nr:hypothetical protein TrST_g6333 [Triparma strigata]